MAFVILALVATALFRLFSARCAMRRRPRNGAARCWSRRAARRAPSNVQPLKEGTDRGTERDGRIAWEASRRAVRAAGREPGSRARVRDAATRLAASRSTVRYAGDDGRDRTLTLPPCGSGSRDRACDAARDAPRGFTLLELLDRAGAAGADVGACCSARCASPARAGTRARPRPRRRPACGSRRNSCARSSTQQHPLRMRKVAEFPLLFGGDRDEIRYAAALPVARGAGGMWYYRLSRRRPDERRPLVLERMMPDVNAARAARLQRRRDVGARRRHRGDQASRTTAATEAQRRRRRRRGATAGTTRSGCRCSMRIDVTPEQGAPWPTLVVAPRNAPEAGCRAFDPTRLVCAGV